MQEDINISSPMPSTLYSSLIVKEGKKLSFLFWYSPNNIDLNWNKLWEKRFSNYKLKSTTLVS